MGILDLFRKKKPVIGMELLLSQFRFAGGTGSADDPIRIEPVDRGKVMAALKGPLAEILAPKKLPASAPPSAKFYFARGLVLKLLKDGFFEKRYGRQGEHWRPGMHMLLKNYVVEMQEVELPDGTTVEFFFDFSDLAAYSLL